MNAPFLVRVFEAIVVNRNIRASVGHFWICILIHSYVYSCRSTSTVVGRFQPPAAFVLAAIDCGRKGDFNSRGEFFLDIFFSFQREK